MASNETDDALEEVGMYYEERMIDGVLCWRNTPDGDWKAVEPETLARRLTDTERQLREAQERCERLEASIGRREQDFRDQHKAQSRMRKAARAGGDRDAEKFHEGAQCMALQAAEQLCGAALSEPDKGGA